MNCLPPLLFATLFLYIGQEVEGGFGTKHAVVRCRRSLSDVLYRRKRCAFGAIEAITLIERWSNPWVTTITDPQAIRDFLSSGMDDGKSIRYEGAGGAGNGDQYSESDCVDTEFLKELEGMETSGYVPKDNQVCIVITVHLSNHTIVHKRIKKHKLFILFLYQCNKPLSIVACQSDGVSIFSDL